MGTGCLPRVYSYSTVWDRDMGILNRQCRTGRDGCEVSVADNGIKVGEVSGYVDGILIYRL